MRLQLWVYKLNIFYLHDSTDLGNSSLGDEWPPKQMNVQKILFWRILVSDFDSAMQRLVY